LALVFLGLLGLNQHLLGFFVQAIDSAKTGHLNLLPAQLPWLPFFRHWHLNFIGQGAVLILAGTVRKLLETVQRIMEHGCPLSYFEL
jgi:hypothetical protein